jgi:hypothetical protein
MGAVAIVGHHSRSSLRIERHLGSVDGGAVQPSGFAGHGVVARRISHVVVKGEPERRATAGRASCGADARLVKIPLGGFGTYELQGAGGVFQRRSHRRLDVVFDAVADIAVIDGQRPRCLGRERVWDWSSCRHSANRRRGCRTRPVSACPRRLGRSQVPGADGCRNRANLSRCLIVILAAGVLSGPWCCSDAGHDGQKSPIPQR